MDGSTRIGVGSVTCCDMTRRRPSRNLETTFALGVAPARQGSADRGIHRPFPIQALTIADALAGRDVCGKAKTGSGKTLAFGLPLLQLVAKAEPRRPTGLVLVPTRELCLQVHDVLAPLGEVRGARLALVYGGADLDKQTRELAAGAEIVVATPGRLIDLLDRKAVCSTTSSTSCSTRPTAWPTWASCPRSSGSSATRTASTRRCCSRPRSTAR